MLKQKPKAAIGFGLIYLIRRVTVVELLSLKAETVSLSHRQAEQFKQIPSTIIHHHSSRNFDTFPDIVSEPPGKVKGFFSNLGFFLDFLGLSACQAVTSFYLRGYDNRRFPDEYSPFTASEGDRSRSLALKKHNYCISKALRQTSVKDESILKKPLSLRGKALDNCTPFIDNEANFKKGK
jgi:hypothetical protein